MIKGSSWPIRQTNRDLKKKDFAFGVRRGKPKNKKRPLVKS
jgi:hypothetical protein